MISVTKVSVVEGCDIPADFCLSIKNSDLDADKFERMLQVVGFELVCETWNPNVVHPDTFIYSVYVRRNNGNTESRSTDLRGNS